MDISDQSDAIALLTRATRLRVCGPDEIIDTHISRIILVGDRAFKMKRPVKLPYVDFSTPELRLAACLKEVDLNSITAPGLYLRVRRLTRDTAGQLALDGDGLLVDAIIEMKRFDQSLLLDQMAGDGRLTPQLLTQTARTIAQFHAEAPVVHAGTGVANLSDVLDINKAGFASSGIFAEKDVNILDRMFRKTLAHHAERLNQREADGKVRRCHGDLHLRNICVLNGNPCLFDCVEFNDKIATVDVLYDLAFLLMDLWHRDFPELANLVMNRYLDETDNEDGFTVLPFLMAVRSAVRAHVIATQIKESGDPLGKLFVEVRAYFDHATKLLRKQSARLIAIGGLSGSGKTTIADSLAAHIGAPPRARIVESDRIRKALYKVPPERRLPDEAYRSEVSDRVYREIVRRAELIIVQGGAVVADAVFNRPDDRVRIEEVTKEQNVPFLGIWLNAPPDVLRRRVEQRRGGPSDATVDVLSQQLAKDAGEIIWRRFDADQSSAQIVSSILGVPVT